MIGDETEEAAASIEERAEVEEIVKSCIASAHSGATDTTVTSQQYFSCL